MTIQNTAVQLKEVGYSNVDIAAALSMSQSKVSVLTRNTKNTSWKLTNPEQYIQNLILQTENKKVLVDKYTQNLRKIRISQLKASIVREARELGFTQQEIQTMLPITMSEYIEYTLNTKIAHTQCNEQSFYALDSKVTSYSRATNNKIKVSTYNKIKNTKIR